MNDVKLLINGSIYEGWKDVSITRSLKTLCGSFELGVTDRWTQKGESIRIVQGSECQIRIDDEQIINGFVDKVDPGYTATSKSIGVSGRDKTSDLVDCSIDMKRTELKKIKLDALARIYCDLFAIEVVVETDIGAAFDVWTIQQGESFYESLEKAAKKRGVLVVTDTLGRLVLIGNKQERATTSLVEGVNIKAGSAVYDHSKRYSNYKVITQPQGSTWANEEEIDSEQIFTEIVGKATDSTVKRYRPLVVHMDSQGGLSDARRRAQWEATVRAAQSTQATIEVVGWRQSDGTLWRPNQLVPLKSPWLGIDQEMLITDVKYFKGEAGTTCTLSLEPKEAYIPEPTVSEKTGLWTELSK